MQTYQSSIALWMNSGTLIWQVQLQYLQTAQVIETTLPISLNSHLWNGNKSDLPQRTEKVNLEKKPVQWCLSVSCYLNISNNMTGGLGGEADPRRIFAADYL